MTVDKQVDMAQHEAVIGDLRITVPVPSASLLTDDGHFISYPYRRVLIPGYEVAVLDEQERDRLWHGPYKIFAGWRLEIFPGMKPSDLAEWGGEGHRRADRLVASALQKLSLCVRGDFSHEFVVADTFDGAKWKRLTPVDTSGHPSHGAGVSIRESRLDTWASLIANWPAVPDKSLELAVEYYCESIAHRRAGRLTSSIVSAAIATEILFNDSKSEVTNRISARAAHLLSRGEDAIRVHRAVKKFYGLRSDVVHQGKPVNKEQIDLWHQMLMHAIPTAAAWPGSITTLRDALDKATFLRVQELDHLQNEDRWWNFCDFSECLRGSVLEPSAGDQQAR